MGSTIDTAAAVVPFVPGGVGAGIKAARGGAAAVEVALETVTTGDRALDAARSAAQGRTILSNEVGSRIAREALESAPEAGLKILPDIVLTGGRGGGNVKNLVGPPSAAVKGGGSRAFVTNEQGQVILDITKERVKPVTPGQGFGPKRAPTEEELRILERVQKGEP